MTASRMVLEGMVPVLMQTPPTTERASTTATRFFILEAATAARCPEGPEPITIRSYLTALMRVSLQGSVQEWLLLVPPGSRVGPHPEATIARRGWGWASCVNSEGRENR